MTLGDQLRAVTDREIEVIWESELQQKLRIQGAKQWRAWLDRWTDLMDFEDVLKGRVELGSFPLLLLSFQRGGLHLEFRRPNEHAIKRRIAA